MSAHFPRFTSAMTLQSVEHPALGERLVRRKSSFRQAVVYFGAAFSIAIVVNRVGFAALGIETVPEVSYVNYPWLATFVWC